MVNSCRLSRLMVNGYRFLEQKIEKIERRLYIPLGLCGACGSIGLLWACVGFLWLLCSLVPSCLGRVLYLYYWVSPYPSRIRQANMNTIRVDLVVAGQNSICFSLSRTPSIQHFYFVQDLIQIYGGPSSINKQVYGILYLVYQ